MNIQNITPYSEMLHTNLSRIPEYFHGWIYKYIHPTLLNRVKGQCYGLSVSMAKLASGSRGEDRSFHHEDKLIAVRASVLHDGEKIHDHDLS